ncbi:ribosome biogenesis protein [Candidatus Woesearchaeota archaeon]|nr:ribosome biogenesis protein [Candidatus Woesearchaeota archaeon]
MSANILFCPHCKKYTLEEKCPSCSLVTILPRPPKYSAQDKYAAYRREEKKKELAQKGLY